MNDKVKQVVDAQKPKPKEFHIDAVTLSEFGFITTQQRAVQEVIEYWNMRLQERMKMTREKLFIPEYWEVNWDQLFSKGCIFATVKPRPEEPKKPEEKKEEHGADH